MSKATQIELHGVYDTYLLTERFRTNLVGKIYLNDKLYLLSRMEVKAETGNYDNVSSTYRLGFVASVGFTISENFMIEIKVMFNGITLVLVFLAKF